MFDSVNGFSRSAFACLHVLICLSVLSLSVADAQSRGTTLEAHTAVDTLGFTVGPRLFTAPVLDSLIEAGVHVDTLVVYPPTIYVTEGGSYKLADMYVTAIDSEGKLVQKAPLTLELKSFNCSFGTDRIVGFRPGKSTMRVTSLLPRKGGKTRTGVEIAVEVTPWP